MLKFDSLTNISLSTKVKKLFKVYNNNTGVDPGNCLLVCNQYHLIKLFCQLLNTKKFNQISCLFFVALFIPHFFQIHVPICIEGYWFVYYFDVSHREVHLLDPNSDQAKSKDISVLNRLVCYTVTEMDYSIDNEIVVFLICFTYSCVLQKRALRLVMATRFDKKIDFSFLCTCRCPLSLTK